MAKVLVSIDDALLREIDAAAKAAGKTRSAWLAEQAEVGIGGPRPTKAQRVDAALALIRDAYAAAPRTDAPIAPAALEIKRMHDERLDRLSRSARRRRTP